MGLVKSTAGAIEKILHGGVNEMSAQSCPHSGCEYRVIDSNGFVSQFKNATVELGRQVIKQDGDVYDFADAITRHTGLIVDEDTNKLICEKCRGPVELHDDGTVSIDHD